MYSEVTAWKRLISHTLTMNERISLIMTIFLDDNQVKTVGQLSGDDAQIFVDMIYEASAHKLLRPRDKSIDFDMDIHVLPIRHWIASYRRSAGGVDAIYAEFVATKPCFRGHWKLHPVTTWRRIRCPVVDLQTCGRANIKARRSQSRF